MSYPFFQHFASETAKTSCESAHHHMQAESWSI